MQEVYHVLKSDQFKRSFLEYLFDLSNSIRKISKSKQGSDFLSSLLSHKRAMLYFTQPSTRTFLSFMSACQILGLKTAEIRDASTSSEKKGESIEDSLRTFSSYVDLIIMRSPIAQLAQNFAELLDQSKRPIPIINAGSGPDEHPTQALLDLYTLHRGFADRGGMHNKTICLVGDLKHGRTIRSLSIALMQYENVDLIFCSPKNYAIADDLRQKLLLSGKITFQETEDFLQSIAKADAIYMTRIQDEYHQQASFSGTEIPNYWLRKKHLDILKKNCVLLHPMPRRQELDPQIDSDPRAWYWRQERNGMWIRAALIAWVFAEDRFIMKHAEEFS